MHSSTIKNITTFILVLISTILVISVLSFASKVSAKEVEDYSFSAEVTATTELSAVIPEEEGINFLAIAAFAVIVAFPAAFLMHLARRKNKSTAYIFKGGNAYNPHRDKSNINYQAITKRILR